MYFPGGNYRQPWNRLNHRTSQLIEAVDSALEIHGLDKKDVEELFKKSHDPHRGIDEQLDEKCEFAKEVQVPVLLYLIDQGYDFNELKR